MFSRNAYAAVIHKIELFSNISNDEYLIILHGVKGCKYWKKFHSLKFNVWAEKIRMHIAYNILHF